MLKSKDASTTLSLFRGHWKRFELRLTRRGVLAYEPKTAIAIQLGRQETQKLFAKTIRFNYRDDFAE